MNIKSENSDKDLGSNGYDNISGKDENTNLKCIQDSDQESVVISCNELFNKIENSVDLYNEKPPFLTDEVWSEYKLSFPWLYHSGSRFSCIYCEEAFKMNMGMVSTNWSCIDRDGSIQEKATSYNISRIRFVRHSKTHNHNLATKILKPPTSTVKSLNYSGNYSKPEPITKKNRSQNPRLSLANSRQLAEISTKRSRKSAPVKSCKQSDNVLPLSVSVQQFSELKSRFPWLICHDNISFACELCSPDPVDVFIKFDYDSTLSVISRRILAHCHSDVHERSNRSDREARITRLQLGIGPKIDYKRLSGGMSDARSKAVPKTDTRPKAVPKTDTRPKAVPRTDTGPWSCPQCKSRFRQNTGLIEHISLCDYQSTDVVRQLSCPCNPHHHHQFHTITKLDLHAAQEHSNQPLFHCFICSDRLCRLLSLYDHMVAHHLIDWDPFDTYVPVGPPSPVTDCNVCSTTLSHGTDLTTHYSQSQCPQFLQAAVLVQEIVAEEKSSEIIPIKNSFSPNICTILPNLVMEKVYLEKSKEIYLNETIKSSRNSREVVIDEDSEKYLDKDLAKNNDNKSSFKEQVAKNVDFEKIPLERIEKMVPDAFNSKHITTKGNHEEKPLAIESNSIFVENFVHEIVADDQNMSTNTSNSTKNHSDIIPDQNHFSPNICTIPQKTIPEKVHLEKSKEIHLNEPLTSSRNSGEVVIDEDSENYLEKDLAKNNDQKSSFNEQVAKNVDFEKIPLERIQKMVPDAFNSKPIPTKGNHEKEPLELESHSKLAKNVVLHYSEFFNNDRIKKEVSDECYSKKIVIKGNGDEKRLIIVSNTKFAKHIVRLDSENFHQKRVQNEITKKNNPQIISLANLTDEKDSTTKDYGKCGMVQKLEINTISVDLTSSPTERGSDKCNSINGIAKDIEEEKELVNKILLDNEALKDNYRSMSEEKGLNVSLIANNTETAAENLAAENKKKRQRESMEKLDETIDYIASSWTKQNLVPMEKSRESVEFHEKRSYKRKLSIANEDLTEKQRRRRRRSIVKNSRERNRSLLTCDNEARISRDSNNNDEENETEMEMGQSAIIVGKEKTDNPSNDGTMTKRPVLIQSQSSPSGKTLTDVVDSDSAETISFMDRMKKIRQLKKIRTENQREEMMAVDKTVAEINDTTNSDSIKSDRIQKLLNCASYSMNDLKHILHHRKKTKTKKNQRQPTLSDMEEQIARKKPKLDLAKAERLDTVSCDICQLKLHSLTARDKHVSQEHRGAKLFKCHVCDIGFATNLLLQKHAMKQHVDIMAFAVFGPESHASGAFSFHCDLCPLIFMSKKGLGHHVTSTHRLDPKKPNDVQVTAMSPVVVIDEFIKKLNEANPQNCVRQCTLCYEMMDNEFELAIHTTDHERDNDCTMTANQFACPECCRLFFGIEGKTYLKDHYNIVHLQKPVPFCDDCKTEFPSTWCYYEHKRTLKHCAKKSNDERKIADPYEPLNDSQKLAFVCSHCQMLVAGNCAQLRFQQHLIDCQQQLDEQSQITLPGVVATTS